MQRGEIEAQEREGSAGEGPLSFWVPGGILLHEVAFRISSLRDGRDDARGAMSDTPEKVELIDSGNLIAVGRVRQSEGCVKADFWFKIPISSSRGYGTTRVVLHGVEPHKGCKMLFTFEDLAALERSNAEIDLGIDTPLCVNASNTRPAFTADLFTFTNEYGKTHVQRLFYHPDNPLALQFPSEHIGSPSHVEDVQSASPPG
jgi:hypothetical protein